jgi:hypothetical protein
MGEAAALAIGTTAVGTGLSATGQYAAGQAAKAAGAVNADAIDRIAEINLALLEEGTSTNVAVELYNARLAEAQARDAVLRGREEEIRFREAGEGLLAEQRADYAGQGVVIDTGSPVDVYTDTSYQLELDALMIRTNAAREAWGFQTEAENRRIVADALKRSGKIQAQSLRESSRAEALSQRLGGTYAAQAGTFGAVGTILSGGAAIARYGFDRVSTKPSTPKWSLPKLDSTPIWHGDVDMPIRTDAFT